MVDFLWDGLATVGTDIPSDVEKCWRCQTSLFLRAFALYRRVEYRCFRFLCHAGHPGAWVANASASTDAVSLHGPRANRVLQQTIGIRCAQHGSRKGGSE